MHALAATSPGPADRAGRREGVPGGQGDPRLRLAGSVRHQDRPLSLARNACRGDVAAQADQDTDAESRTDLPGRLVRGPGLRRGAEVEADSFRQLHVMAVEADR